MINDEVRHIIELELAEGEELLGTERSDIYEKR